MGRILSIIGYLILGFIVLSNYINIQLSNTFVVILSIISAVFMIIGIIVKDKEKDRR